MIKKLAPLLILALILSGCAGNSAPRTSQPSVGSSDAPVVVEEFSDLQCPACAYISPQVKQVVEANPSIAQMRYFHFPLPQHTQAFKAAEAAECALDQGKFWEYVELTFQNQKDLNADLLYTMAKTLELDEVKFTECLDSGSKKDLVKADLNEGYRRGVRATPTIYVNGQETRFTSIESFGNYLQSLAVAAEGSR